jgi:hypothetical protein
MIRPDDPTVTADYQIDPYRSPYFQMLQPQVGSDAWLEVGFVWTIGSSRTNSQENWYLYDTVSDTARAPYKWPGFLPTGGIVGLTLRLVPAVVPAGQTPTTLATYLQRANNVTLTYIQGTMVAGPTGTAGVAGVAGVAGIVGGTEAAASASRTESTSKR